MIVRITGEGQFELGDSQAERLNQLDNDACAAVAAHDDARFEELWSQILALIEREGRPVPNDELFPSDVILPPRDVSRSVFVWSGTRGSDLDTIDVVASESFRQRWHSS